MVRVTKCFGWISLTFLLLLPACSKDEPTAPPPQESEYLAAATIGPQGGALTSEGFVLRIPEGAFSTTAELRLKRGPDNPGFGANLATQQFQVEGIPTVLSKPLSIGIRHGMPLSGQSFIGVGHASVVPGTDSTDIAYRLLSARDSASIMISEIPVLPKAAPGRFAAFGGGWRGSSNGMIDFFLGITAYDTTRHGRYVLYRPRTMDGYLGLGIMLAFGATEQIVKQMGLPFYEEGKEVEAFVKSISLRPSAYALYYPVWVRNWNAPILGGEHETSVILLREEKMTMVDRVKVTAQAGRELFYIVPEVAYETGSNPASYLAADHFWLHTAIASWMETKLVAQADPNHIPTEFQGNEMKALDGILAGAATEERDVSLRNGFGKSALIKFLADNYRETVVWRMYEELKKERHPVDAVLNSLADPTTFWWPAFVRTYVAGSIYAVPASTLLENTTGSFPIRTASDTLATFEESYRDLSAKLFLIDLSYPGIESSASLRFTVLRGGQMQSSASVLLFGLNNGTLEYWAEGTDVNVTKIRDLTAAGQDLLAAVVNSACSPPYGDFADLDLKVRVMTRPVFSLAAIQVKTRSTVEYSDGSTYTNSIFLYNTGIGKFHEGVFTDSVFTATWDKPPSKGSLIIKGNFNATGISTITYFDVTETVTQTDTETWRIRSIQPAGIIGGKMSWGSHEFSANGIAACGQIATITNRLDGLGGYWRQVTGFSCDADSYVRIVLE